MRLVAKFLIKDIIYKYRIFERLIINSGPKNKGIIKDLAKYLEFKRVQILIYNALTNRIIKVKYKPIINILFKLIGSSKRK